MIYSRACYGFVCFKTVLFTHLLFKQSALRPVYGKDVMIEAFVASLTSLSD